jgi:hypothetical protein
MLNRRTIAWWVANDRKTPNRLSLGITADHSSSQSFGAPRASQSTPGLNLLLEEPAQSQDSRDNQDEGLHKKINQRLRPNNPHAAVTQGHRRSISLSKFWTRRQISNQSNSKADRKPTPEPAVQENVIRRLKFCFVGDGGCGKTGFLT